MADIKIWVGTDIGNEGDYATAANWSPAGVPAATDNVYFENSSQDCDDSLDQSAVALGSFNVDQSYTGKMGTTAAYLQIAAALVKIGYHYNPDSPLGSGRIKLDLGAATAAAVVVENTGNSFDDNLPALRIIAAHANTTMEFRKGSVGVACETGETSTVSTITASYVSQVTGDLELYVGSGVTLTTYTQNGGDCILGCAVSGTTTMRGGKLQTVGTGAVVTINATGGTVTPNSTGTITTLAISDSAAVDFTKSAAARTVTTCKLDASGKLKFDPAVVTFTNKIISDNPVTYQAAAA